MDASPDVLAEAVGVKRVAIGNDLELLRVRLQSADPRRIDLAKWGRRVLPVAGATAALCLWARRRRGVDSMEQLLVHGLRDLYQAEHQLVPALDRMRVRASSEELEKAFGRHLDETRGHIERLERVFRSIGARPKRGSTAAVTAILTDAQRLFARKGDRDVRDAWLIATAQRIEHFEIASYGTVRTYAQTLGYTLAAQLLQQTLEEERTADETLTHLALRFVNPPTTRSSRPR